MAVSVSKNVMAGSGKSSRQVDYQRFTIRASDRTEGRKEVEMLKETPRTRLFVILFATAKLVSAAAANTANGDVPPVCLSRYQEPREGGSGE